MELIDSHCHLDDDRFDERRGRVVRHYLTHGTLAGLAGAVLPAPALVVGLGTGVAGLAAG